MTGFERRNRLPPVPSAARGEWGQILNLEFFLNYPKINKIIRKKRLVSEDAERGGNG
jgi:hypothetical protein